MQSHAEGRRFLHSWTEPLQVRRPHLPGGDSGIQSTLNFFCPEEDCLAPLFLVLLYKLRGVVAKSTARVLLLINLNMSPGRTDTGMDDETFLWSAPLLFFPWWPGPPSPGCSDFSLTSVSERTQSALKLAPETGERIWVLILASHMMVTRINIKQYSWMSDTFRSSIHRHYPHFLLYMKILVFY